MASSKNKAHIYAAGTVIVKGRGLNQKLQLSIDHIDKIGLFLKEKLMIQIQLLQQQ